MASRDVYIQLRHELNAAIDAAFRDSGIDMAFPQQDIHIRSLPAGLLHEGHAVRGPSFGSRARE